MLSSVKGVKPEKFLGFLLFLAARSVGFSLLEVRSVKGGALLSSFHRLLCRFMLLELHKRD